MLKNVKKCGCGLNEAYADCETGAKRFIKQVEKSIPNLSYDIVEGNLKHLQGQMLTLVEAVILDKGQLEATKSLVRGRFNEKLTHLFDMYGPGDRELPNYEEENYRNS